MPGLLPCCNKFPMALSNPGTSCLEQFHSDPPYRKTVSHIHSMLVINVKESSRINNNHVKKSSLTFVHIPLPFVYMHMMYTLDGIKIERELINSCAY